MSHDFDNSEVFVLSIISFLKHVGWLKGADDGSYIVTDKGEYILAVQMGREEKNPEFDSDKGVWRY